MKRKLLIFTMLLIAISSFAGERMFFISRNLNNNIIVYDLQLKNGKLNKKEPLHAYWYNQENNPVTTKELSFIQRKMAYGYSVVKCTDDEAVITMKALDKRTLKLRKHNGKWIATTTINGKKCQLTEVYAHCPSRTSCDYIIIQGKCLADGSPQKERMNN